MSQKLKKLSNWYSTKNFVLPLITFPSVDRDLLMAEPSFSRSPVAPVESARSLPARSTKFTMDVLVVFWPVVSFFPFCVNVKATMVWARLCKKETDEIQISRWYRLSDLIVIGLIFLISVRKEHYNSCFFV